MRLKKSLGQHFLRDPHMIEAIVSAIHPESLESFVEIGPGAGALTCALLPHVTRLDAVELDTEVIPLLKKNTSKYPYLTIHHANALEFHLSQLPSPTSGRFRLVGNLPYYISTPLIFHFLAQSSRVEDMHWMLQKEVALRLCAPAGDSERSRLSVMTQYHCAFVETLLDVPPDAFTPPPKVDSMVVRLIPHRVLPFPEHDPELFKQLVATAFNQRRKTLRKSLQAYWKKGSGNDSTTPANACGIDLQRRPETLSVLEWVELSRSLSV